MQVTRTYLAGSPRPVNRLGQADILVFLHRLIQTKTLYSLPTVLIYLIHTSRPTLKMNYAEFFEKYTIITCSVKLLIDALHPADIDGIHNYPLRERHCCGSSAP